MFHNVHNPTPTYQPIFFYFCEYYIRQSIERIKISKFWNVTFSTDAIIWLFGTFKIKYSLHKIDKRLINLFLREKKTLSYKAKDRHLSFHYFLLYYSFQSAQKFHFISIYKYIFFVAVFFLSLFFCSSQCSFLLFFVVKSRSLCWKNECLWRSNVLWYINWVWCYFFMSF